MRDIKAVVFDVDGTLLNTLEHIIKAFEMVLPQFGLEVNRERIRSVIGKTLIECYKELAPDGDHEHMARLHHEAQQTPEMYELIEEYEGLRETLELIERKGMKSAVLTNRTNPSLGMIFNRIGLEDAFDIIITPHDVTHAKPHPEGLLLVADKLELQPDRLVMVGDTPIDILTGKNAGAALTIAVTHGFSTREELEAVKPDSIIDTLLELPLLFD